jgi:arylsulfatase A-like enzyme
MATWLSDAGYATGFIGKYLNGYLESTGGSVVPPGWDTWRGLGLNGYRADWDSPWNYSQDGVLVDPPNNRYMIDWTADESVEFLSTTDPDVPAFLIASPFAPHPPTKPRLEDRGVFTGVVHRSPAVDERDVSDKPRWVRQSPRIGPGRQAKIDHHLQKAMEVSLALDDMVVEINDAVIARGRPAVIVYMSDNGYLWGEHRDVGKNVAYDGALRVPAGMWSLNGDASIFPGTVVAAPVSNIDIAPTFAELAEVQSAPEMEGRSIVPFVDDPALGTDLGRDRILVEHVTSGGIPSYCAVREESWLYVRYQTGEEEAYNYSADPYELHNVVRTRRQKEKLASLRGWTKRNCSPRPPGFAGW